MEGLPIAFEPAYAGAVVLPSNMGHSSASHFDKVFCRQTAGFYFINANKVRRSPFMSRSIRTYG